MKTMLIDEIGGIKAGTSEIKQENKEMKASIEEIK